MNCDKKKAIDLLEFSVIFTVFVLPPMCARSKSVLYTVPETALQQFFFILKICFLASFEEILYRLYLPFRLKTVFVKIKRYRPAYFFITELVPLFFFAAAHIYLGIASAVYAFFAGSLFRVLYVTLKMKINKNAALISIIALHTVNNAVVFAYIF